MLSAIRPSSYNANMRALNADFYDFREREDELAAPLIAKSIRRLLRRVPVLITRKKQLADEARLAALTSEEGKWSKNQGEESVGRLFHSDSSLSSNSSSVSSDSCGSSSSSLFDSRSSLPHIRKQRKKIKEDRHVEVLLPNDMMNRLVRDIVRMAEGEAHGIRGCQLQLQVIENESNSVHNVGKINCDSKISPSCVLHVQLSSTPPPPEAHGSQVLLNRFLGSLSHNIYIKPGYTIEKTKVES